MFAILHPRILAMPDQRLYTRFKLVKRRRRPSPKAALWMAGGLVLAAVAVWLWRTGVGPAGVKAPPLNGSLTLPTNQLRDIRPAPRPTAPATAKPVAPTKSPTPIAPPPALPPRTLPPPAATVAPTEILAAQIALNRAGISSGSIDGVLGSQTSTALRAFQQERGILASGLLDAATKEALGIRDSLLTTYAITAEDLTVLRPLGKTWLAKSQQDILGFENLLELVAERSHTHPKLLQQLNPTVEWNTLLAGDRVNVPAAPLPAARAKVARIRISLSSKTLQAFDANDKLLAHFPVSIGRIAEKRPVGELRVANLAPNPNYTFDPAIFPESPEARRLDHKLVLPPGPNSPVGTAWIGLDRPGFGIHGTPNPEQVGRTESHGCFRLANWNAEYLARLVWVGLPIIVEP